MVWLQDLHREERIRTQVDSDCFLLHNFTGKREKTKSNVIFLVPGLFKYKDLSVSGK